MIVSDRLKNLETIVERNPHHVTSDHEINLFASVVDNLNQAAIQLSIVAKVGYFIRDLFLIL